MWSKERVLTCIEYLQCSACLWSVHCAHYKNRIKKCDAIGFLVKKKYEFIATEVERKIASVNDHFRKEHKKVVAAKKVVSSPKTPI